MQERAYKEFLGRGSAGNLGIDFTTVGAKREHFQYLGVDEWRDWENPKSSKSTRIR
jgi:hypothetical protein